MNHIRWVERDRWARRIGYGAPSPFDKLRVLSQSKDDRALPQNGYGFYFRISALQRFRDDPASLSDSLRLHATAPRSSFDRSDRDSRPAAPEFRSKTALSYAFNVSTYSQVSSAHPLASFAPVHGSFYPLQASSYFLHGSAYLLQTLSSPPPDTAAHVHASLAQPQPPTSSIQPSSFAAPDSSPQSTVRLSRSNPLILNCGF
jgi:hypothetical protein